MIHAEAYHYLRHKTKPIIGMSFPESQFDVKDIEEIPMSLPLVVEVSDGTVYWNNRLFANKPESLTYASVKTSIIKSRYSDDDQMALILNKERSEEDAVFFEKMQEWRNFAGYIAKDIFSAD